MNTLIGKEAGYSINSGWQNTIIGFQAGKNLQTGTGNIFLGYWAGFNETGSRKLYIDNSATSTPIIFGELVATVTPTTPRYLRFNATVSVNSVEYSYNMHHLYGLWVDGGSSALYSMYVYKGAYTNGSWATGSDLRWKKDIVTLTNVTDKLKLARGVNYYFRTEEYPEMKFSDRLQVGVIAQEMEAIFPEVVLTDEQGYKSVAYDKLSAILLQAVKEQQEKIDELVKFKEENIDLKARLERLEKLIQEMAK
jgi:hypothetical protein